MTPEPIDNEQRWRSLWEEQGIYRYDPARGREDTFVVDTPPPTASGSLHIGHCMSYTHTDLMVRYNRMRGKNIFYPMGWDDNGLPTERRVQNVLGIRCEPSLPYDSDLELEWGREGDAVPVSRRNFIEACDVVVRDDERKFKDVFQRLALSVDWTKTYETINERCRYVSQYSFLRMLQRGQVELREAPTMWDIDYQTAVAQAEVEDRERAGEFHRIRFGVAGSAEDLLISTTRPELLPACIAVVAHPDDGRYRHLIGKTAVTPLFDAPVPIMAAEHADPEKGTGVLMVCTFGDAADVEWWRTMGIPAREVIGKDGRIKAAPWGEGHWETNSTDAARQYQEKLAGISVKQARKEIVSQLRERGLLEGDPQPTTRMVKFYERGERPLEFVVTRQWFVKLMHLKQELLDQGRKIAWHPASMRRRYEDWVVGLNQDWCISRQRYFGVPFPVWYQVRDDGVVDYTATILPEKEALPVDPSAEAPPGYDEGQRGRPGGFVGDGDVLDTWGTSSLTPLIPTGWPDDGEQHQKLYPNDLRPQAHEIIRTWAFYTIVRSYLEDGSVPWTNIAISGFVVDPERKKMSKSKGNVVLPTDVLDQYGSDAVRYWAASARLGVDATADPNVWREGKRLVTKIRNAGRLVLGYEGEAGTIAHPLDRALVARLSDLIQHATVRWDDYDHAGAVAATETFFWSDFCDNYLELSKSRAYARDGSALAALRLSLDVLLRLFAPVVPYVSEEIWHSARRGSGSIHVASWPDPTEIPDGEDEGRFETVVAVMTHIRKIKSEAKVSMKTPVDHLEVRGPAPHLELIRPMMDDITATAHVRGYELLDRDVGDGLVVSARLGEPDRSKA